MIRKVLKYFQFTKRNVWFILGPAGSGKSTFSKYLAQRENWLHLEIDLFSINEDAICIDDKDGIDVHRLRREWDLFYKENRGKPMVRKIRQCYSTAKKNGAVLSFPSTTVLTWDHIAAIRKDIRVVYLFGEKQFCIDSFLRREKLNRRGLGLTQWQINNRATYAALSDPSLQSHSIDVFNRDGTHKTGAMIYDQIISDIH